MSRIKICGLFRPCDVDFVNQAGPDWCGFVLNVPKSHRSLTPDQARALRARLDSAIVPVGVFVDQPVEEVAALLRDGTIQVAQLHGQEDEGYLATLRALAPGREVWRAFQVRAAADLERAARFPADRIVLDSGQGSGKPFNWALLRGFPRSYLLAGGLTPENLRTAVRTLRPFGVDLSSGVECQGCKDQEKILAAVRAAREE